jgi:hypothetical protein
MISFDWMEKELDQFHEDHDGRKNMKALIDFDQIDISFSEVGLEFSTPKMKKKLTANPWTPLKNNKGQLF